MALNDVEKSNQAIKSNFLLTFVNCVWMYIEDRSVILIDFVD